MANPNNFDSLFANGSFPNSSIGTFANAAANPFMTKSPFTDYKWQFLKRESTEIEKLFFPSGKQKKQRMLTLKKEEDCNCSLEIQELLKDTLVVYNESGETKGYQEKEDDLLFYIKIFISKDGLKVEQAASECKPDPDEIVFFLEDNTDDYSSQKMYANFGTEVTETLKKTMTDRGLLYSKIQGRVPDITLEMIDELLSKGFVEQSMTATKLFIKGILFSLETFGLVGRCLAWVCSGIGDLVLNYLAIPEKVWNTDSSDYFLKKNNVIEALTISNETVGKIEQYFNQDTAGAFYRSALPGFAEKTVNTTVSTLQTFIERYNLYITQSIDTIYAEFENTVITANIILQISEKIAFLCGIWNGLVDFIGGILKFLGMIAATPYAIGANGHNVLELFDSFLAVLQKPDLFEDMKKAFWDTLEKIKKYFQEQNSSDINSDKVAYAIGFGLAFVGTFFIPIANFTKIATFAKTGKALLPARYLEEISAAVHKTGEIFTKTGEILKGKYDEAILIVQKVLSLLQEGKDAIAKFLEKIAKKIAEWFLKARKTLKDLASAFTKDKQIDELYRDILKKFYIIEKTEGEITLKAFQKISASLSKYFGIEIQLIEEGTIEFAELYQKWKEDPVYAFFMKQTAANSRYGLKVKGPSLYFFKGGNMTVTYYSLQHELIHVELWYRMVKASPQYAALYEKIPNMLHEAHVLGTFLKLNKASAIKKWKITDIIQDLEKLNENIGQNPHWRKAAKELFGKEKFELQDFENWDLSEYLTKLK